MTRLVVHSLLLQAAWLYGIQVASLLLVCALQFFNSMILGSLLISFNLSVVIARKLQVGRRPPSASAACACGVPALPAAPGRACFSSRCTGRHFCFQAPDMPPFRCETYDFLENQNLDSIQGLARGAYLNAIDLNFKLKRKFLNFPCTSSRMSSVACGHVPVTASRLWAPLLPRTSTDFFY